MGTAAVAGDDAEEWGRFAHCCVPIFRRFKTVATPAIVIPGCAEGAGYDAQLRI
jgi:hypothetical protein